MGRLIAAFATVCALALAWLLAWPYPPPHAPAIAPARTYPGALVRIEGLRARDPVDVVPGCGTRALLHGHRTPRAVVLLHGITNCPLQFRVIAESLAVTDNVLVPRVDHHGLSDRMGRELKRLTAEELARMVSECAGIARGLGDTVVVAGLSTSGVAAAWSGAHVPGVDRVVLIAPAFAPAFTASLPRWVPHALTRAALRVPDRFVWWDAHARRALPGPAQCYYGFSTHAMAQAYRLGRDVAAGPFAPREAALLVTDGDEAVDNGPSADLLRHWRRTAPGTRVREVAFPAGAHVLHDMVDPDQVGQRVEVAYPVILALVRGQALPPGTPARERSLEGGTALAVR